MGDRQSESDRAFLAELSDAFTPAATPHEVARIATTKIARHLELSRCLLAEIDAAEQDAQLSFDHSSPPQEVAGPCRLSDIHTTEERSRLATGAPVVINDGRSDSRPPGAIAAFQSLEIGSLVSAPYIGDGRLKFVLTAIRPAAHAWPASTTRLLQELAARTYLRLERARAEEALRAAHDTFHHLVEHSPFGVYAVDADFRLVQVSAGAQRVFQNVRPLLGRDFAEVLRLIWPEPFATEAINIFRHTLETGQPYHAPSTVERRQDIGVVEAYDWKTERLTLPDGRFGVVCHFYDLSERQRYEAALRDADRQKDEFLAMLAHELRNPLAPIRTAVGILRLRGPADPLVAKCGDTIDRQVSQMARLLDDLLDVSRLSRGRLVLKQAPVVLDEVLEAAAETSRPFIDRQDQQLAVMLHDSGLVLDGDAVRLTQVFANLLNNAAKFSPPGSRIEVDVRKREGEAVVRVRDTGIGIPGEMLDRVFDLFAQGSNAREHGPGGLGIGLSLARRLVELHGGTIAVASAGPNRGSEFTVSLPLSASIHRAEPAAERPVLPSLAGRRVLIVDDNADAADVIAILLGETGCDARTVYTGEAALHEAESFRPHVVLLDLGLPNLDGYEVCRRIRSLPWGRDMVLIAISGWGREEDRRRTAEAGFDRHLMKPVDPDALLRTIRETTTDG